MSDALYLRQSVDRADSISIESQSEFCKFETRGNPYKEYIDRGYSGKNTNRPAFSEMLSDIKKGLISRVIVYKLDRISRSILDFANMMDFFQKYGVEFISSTEKFDTSTPIGRAMLNICIVFAQLERETIQKRVSDSYSARSKRGFYMGGRLPYGYTKKNTEIDGIKTSMYIPIKEEADQVKLMYSLYADRSNSLGDIIKFFAENSIKNLRGAAWNTSRISEILHNPIYVAADADIYDFFKKNGALIIDPPTDFTGKRGCYLYNSGGSKKNSRFDFFGKEIVLAPHEGIISSEIWLKCRARSSDIADGGISAKAKNSWLLGKVRCENCHSALSVARSNTAHGRYFVCPTSIRTKKMLCPGCAGTIYADVLEKYISEKIYEKLSCFSFIRSMNEKSSLYSVNEKKIRIFEIDEKIEELLSKIPHANETLIGYIGEMADKLTKEKIELENIIFQAESSDKGDKIYSPADKWRQGSFQLRRIIADILIKSMEVGKGCINITWNI